MATETIQRRRVKPKDIFCEESPEEEVKDAQERIDPDKALEIELDASELEDSAQAIIGLRSLNNTAELLEGMRKDFMSSGYSVHDWLRVLPLAQKIACSCFAQAEQSGLLTKSQKWPRAEPLSVEECTVARTSPDLLVDNYLSEDVSLLIGAGGNGKT
jgi:hypothetical protein